MFPLDHFQSHAQIAKDGQGAASPSDSAKTTEGDLTKAGAEDLTKDAYLNAAGNHIVCASHGAEFEIETGR